MTVRIFPLKTATTDQSVGELFLYQVKLKSYWQIYRVRFSPTTLIDLPVPGQSLDTTVPLQARRNRARPTLAEMEREFLS